MKIKQLLQKYISMATASRPWVYIFAPLAYEPGRTVEPLPNPAEVASPLIKNIYENGYSNSVVTDLYSGAVGDIVGIFRLPDFLTEEQIAMSSTSQTWFSKYAPGVENLILFLKFLALLLVIGGILVIINIFIRRKEAFVPELPLVEQIHPSEPVFSGAMTARWQDIIEHMNSPKESEWRMAVIEADKLVEEVFRQAGYPGATMGERLMNMPEGHLESFQSLWDAHKIRNRLVHDIDYFLRYSEAKRIINSYEHALRELKAI